MSRKRKTHRRPRGCCCVCGGQLMRGQRIVELEWWGGDGERIAGAGCHEDCSDVMAQHAAGHGIPTYRLDGGLVPPGD